MNQPRRGFPADELRSTLADAEEYLRRSREQLRKDPGNRELLAACQRFEESIATLKRSIERKSR